MVFSLASGSFLLITHLCSHSLEQNRLRDWLLIKRNLLSSILSPGQTSEYKQVLSYTLLSEVQNWREHPENWPYHLPFLITYYLDTS